MSEKYDANSIEHLSFVEGCRLRVGVYLGSADNDGVLNGLLEIINNSVDEANAGFGKEIIIEINDNRAIVRDFGRGLPRGKTDKSEEIMVTLLTENHSGAKFNKKSYSGFSRGLNGSGGGATCVTSDWMNVTSWRDGYEWSMRFEKGIPTTKVATRGQKESRTGTLIEWQPSQEVFSTEEIHFDYGRICQIIEEYSYFNAGIKFIVKNIETGKVEEYLSNNGLIDFAKNKITDTIHKHPIMYKGIQDGIEIEIIAQWTKAKEKYYLFVNGAECPEGGTPLTGARTAITRTINNISNGSFDGDLIRKGLIYIIAIKHPTPIFANQIKSKISNAELRTLCDKAFSEAIKQFSTQHKAEFDKVIELLTKVEKASLAASKAYDAIINHQRESANAKKSSNILLGTLRDAKYLGENATLLLVEGKSAAGSMSVSRDPNKYGILPIKGKSINALSNPIEDVLENDEVKAVLHAIGLTYGQRYNPKQIRYGRVAICSDRDDDGLHVALLIMAMLYKLAPEYLKDNRLYWLLAPLYRVVSKGKTMFYYSDEELTKAPKGDIIYYKGLGQMSAEDAKNSMFNPKEQRLDLINYSDAGAMVLEQLMGEDVQPRKDFVFSTIDFDNIEV